MNTEHTAIISLSCIIGMIYLTRLIMHLKTRRYKPLKPKGRLLYQNKDKVSCSFANEVYEPCREYDVCECVNKEWVMVKQQINLN